MVIPLRNIVDRYQAMATFIRVVDTGSFSAAARQLGVGQSAVSKTVAQLEARLQVSLLSRSTHGLTPTEAGQNFYERARNAIQEADEAELPQRELVQVCQADCGSRRQRRLQGCISSRSYRSFLRTILS